MVLARNCRSDLSNRTDTADNERLHICLQTLLDKGERHRSDHQKLQGKDQANLLKKGNGG